VTAALAELFPTDPPRFLARTPHGYFERHAIQADLAAAGFAKPEGIETVTARSRASSAQVPAIAYCQGTPLRNEILARDSGGLQRATAVATDAIAARFGDRAVDGQIQALVVTIEK